MNFVTSIFLILITCSTLCETVAQSLTSMSFNIRMDTPNDGENQWKYRKAELVGLLKDYKTDFFGLQEAMWHQRTYVDSCMSHYLQIGVGRDDGKNKGEATPIFYNSQKYKLIQHATFFLSQTPNEVSKGWDAAYNRLCTYGLFENIKGKQRIWIFNTHFDHRGEVARVNSARLMLAKIAELTKGEPVILMGDLNLTPDNEPYKILTHVLADAFKEVKRMEGPTGTWNGFEVGVQPDRRIDYVFYKNMEVVALKHIEDKRDNGLWVSDHLPVYVKLNILSP